MKKILFAMGIICTVAITSCKDDFKVAAPYKNITIAYAIFNRADTAHYIRIQKAFLDETKSAIVMAQNADSSFFKESDLTVTIKEFDANGNFRRSWPLSRVDMNTQGDAYVKQQPGSQGFFTSPNWGYKLKLPNGTAFDPYFKYRVVINNSLTGENDSSDFYSPVNSEAVKGNSNTFYINAFTNSFYSISFAVTDHNTTYSLSGTTPLNGRMLEGVIRFHIVEKNAAANTRKDLFADFTYDSRTNDPTKPFTLSTPTLSFYTFLKGAFGAAPANTVRYIDSCDMFVYCGSEELYNYQQVNIAQTGGILGDQIKPIYSNFRGANIYGLVATRAARSQVNVPIDNVTIDSMKINPLTRDMGIQGRSDD